MARLRGSYRYEEVAREMEGRTGLLDGSTAALGSFGSLVAGLDRARDALTGRQVPAVRPPNPG